MAKLTDSLSVYFPAYNEEANLQNTVLKAIKVLEEVAGSWEIIIVNDGSKDNTLGVARELAVSEKRIRIINHGINRGYGASMKSGLYNAQYPWIAFSDSDGQFDFSEIKNFLETQQKTQADLVIGYYKDRQVGLITKITSKIWELLVLVLFGLNVKAIDCGFKLFSKKAIDALPKLESERGAFISSEILIKAKKMGFKIVEIPVTHYPRRAGKPTGRHLDVIIKSFGDLFRLWRKLK